MTIPIPDKFPFPPINWMNPNFFSCDFIGQQEQKDLWNTRGMYAFVCWTWIEPMAKWIGKRKVLEVMAGGGWLAKALHEKQVDIVATDDHSWKEKFKWDLQHPVEELTAIDAIEKYGSRSDILIMAWPYMNSDGFNAIKAWNRVNPGGLIIYVGEPPGGCTADESFFEHFKQIENSDFQRISNKYRTWHGLHDSIILGQYE